ncbi:hypothetical protein N7499_011293 [Penicillium canescens]|nr:hypothetical protein N7499_011293 [Penicillium canescens]KAJ6182542.1 hypothetical protein N7485_001184 [Penicillium canescens]
MTDPTSTKTDLLEQRLDSLERELRSEIQELRASIVRSPESNRIRLRAQSSSPAPLVGFSQQEAVPSTSCDDETLDITPNNIPAETEWSELYAFFVANCRDLIAVIDDQLCSTEETVKHNPLMSAVISAIVSKAIKPERHHYYASRADQLIKGTFQGPLPDILSVNAMMIFAAWAGRTRLYGYIASICTELQLHEDAMILSDPSTIHTPELVARARCWLTLCCLNLQTNLSRPFMFNEMRDCLCYSTSLLTSPFRRPVDDRICTYIEGFRITADLTAKLKNSQLKSRPLLPEVAALLTFADQDVEKWFHTANNRLHPLYQTFSDRQDRNRLLLPFCFMKLYINGLVLQGLELPHDLDSDPARIEYIQRAFETACLIIRSQFDSTRLRKSFKFAMDYIAIPTNYAISFILKILPLAHMHVDCKKALIRLRQAAEIFEEAGALETASEILRNVDRMAFLPQPHGNSGVSDNSVGEISQNALFDIPGLLAEMTWDNGFPAMGTFSSA